MADSVLHKQEDSMPESEPALPSKRKRDPLPIPPQGKEEETDQPNKTQKLQSLTHNGNSPVNISVANSSIPEEKNISKADTEGNDVVVEEEEDADYDNDDEEEEENGEVAVVDRKGKGIMLEEEEDDDSGDDDSSDCGSELDGDVSELEDDPLAEVDLDNILPSRTRRRAAQPGVYIANDLGNNDDDTDDSDA